MSTPIIYIYRSEGGSAPLYVIKLNTDAVAYVSTPQHAFDYCSFYHPGEAVQVNIQP